MSGDVPSGFIGHARVEVSDNGDECVDNAEGELGGKARGGR